MSLSRARWLKKIRAYRDGGADFVALWVKDGEEAELIYYLNMAGRIETLRVLTECRSVPSIYTIFGDADWAEREACRNYHIKFIGNPNLILQDSDQEEAP